VVRTFQRGALKREEGRSLRSRTPDPGVPPLPKLLARRSRRQKENAWKGNGDSRRRVDELLRVEAANQCRRTSNPGNTSLGPPLLLVKPEACDQVLLGYIEDLDSHGPCLRISVFAVSQSSSLAGSWPRTVIRRSGRTLQHSSQGYLPWPRR
jgi:hypothetical protein